MADLRITFNDTFSDLIDEILGSGFLSDLSQVAMFCAALASESPSEANARGSRSLRLSVLESSAGATELISALAFTAKNLSESKDELTPEGKIRLFERHVNGGLEILQHQKELGRPMSVAIPTFINKYAEEVKK
jgi:hypothetical protein